MNARSHNGRIAFLAIVAAAMPFTAYAHSVDLFAYVSGDTIQGNVAYADGTPIADATIEVSWNSASDAHEGGASETTVQTNSDGDFEFSPPTAAEYLFICRTADGHRAAKSLVFGGSESNVSQTNNSIQQQLNALQEQLHEYERRTRLRDVIGGIGYILGLAGVIALIKTRRRA